jgi:hypothetical protein
MTVPAGAGPGGGGPPPPPRARGANDPPGSRSALFRSDSTSAATWRRSLGVSSSMLAIRSSRSGSPGFSGPAGASS